MQYVGFERDGRVSETDSNKNNAEALILWCGTTCDNTNKRPCRTRTDRNSCNWIRGDLRRPDQPAPSIERPNVHRVFRAFPRLAAIVSYGSVAREPESFSTPAAVEPGNKGLHPVLHSVHLRHVSPSQGRIHFQSLVEDLGTRNQVHVGGSPFQAGMGGSRLRVRLQPRLHSVRRLPDARQRTASLDALPNGSSLRYLAILWLPDSYQAPWTLFDLVG
jgi:hypothetical protein